MASGRDDDDWAGFRSRERFQDEWDRRQEDLRREDLRHGDLNRDLEDWKRRLEDLLKAGDLHRDGRYGEDLKILRGLSVAEIDAITPGDVSGYISCLKLIHLVEEASRGNMEFSTLRERVLELGAVAVEIAKKVPPLAAKLAL